MMRSHRSLCFRLIPAGLILLATYAAMRPAGAADVKAPATQPATQPVKQVQIDMDKAIPVALPAVKEPLKPVGFETSDHKTGWVVKLPGDRPIATPAYAEVEGRGMLFVGGGYGSHEFYAFDARTGEKVWEIKTGDDGPTAAVVEDGYVAFNTESCTVIVVEAKTGKLVWQEWLGDPLMSQPAISKGKLYMAFPAGQRGQGAANVPNAVAPPVQQQANVPNAVAPPVQQQAGAVPAHAATHRLLCADLKTGKHLWEQDLAGDVISAPVIDGDQVFITCFEGTSFCLNSGDGKVIWTKANSGTSAPVVADGQVVITQKEVRDGQAFEGIRRLDAGKGGDKEVQQSAQAKADYLTQGKAQSTGLAPTQSLALDTSVGFAVAPTSAGLFGSGGAAANVNVNNVAEGWAYQGSKAAYSAGRIFNAQGNAFNCLDSRNGQLRWRGLARGKDVGENAQIFAPPALGGKYMYLCSVRGHLLSVAHDDGQMRFIYAFDQPMAFQPCLAGGRMYAGTTVGSLICLDTGDKDADGWTAWGGNAQHNKK